MAEDRKAYLYVAPGAMELNGRKLAAGHGAGMAAEDAIRLTAPAPAEVLSFGLR